MSLRGEAMEKNGGKTRGRHMAMASSAAKRLGPVEESVAKKPAPKKPAATKKSAPAKKTAPAKKPAISAAKPPAPPRLATPLPLGEPLPKPATAAAKPAPSAPPRPITASGQSVDERRKAAT